MSSQKHDDAVGALPTVLMVEDDPVGAMALHALLTKDGFDVTTVGDGESALAYCDTHEPDIILLDYALPGITGQQVCAELRPKVTSYIVMVTGRDNEVDKVISLATGADDYVTKPYSPLELTARLRALLRRPRALVADGAATRLRKYDNEGMLVIDKAAREVTMNGKPVELTRIEFDLLAALAEHARIALSRRRLLEMVWHTKWDGDDHVVDTHLYNVRRKLREAGIRSECIVTVRGVGYRFDLTASPDENDQEN